MDVQLKHQPSFTLAVVRLESSETIKVEPGAMVSYSEGITTDTKAEGGLFGGLKRVLGGENFFQNTYTAPAQGGEITLAPPLAGDMMTIEIGADGFYLQSGAYIASESSVNFEASWGGAKGFFGSGSLVLLRVTGSGTVLASSYGAIEERVIASGERYYVDTGHIIGFDASLSFQVQKIGTWKSTILGGEGLVCQLTGPGRVLIQTRSDEALVQWMMSRLPRPSNNNS